MKVLITGAISGIGYDLAKVLAFRGHAVYACYENEEEKREYKEEENLHLVKLDLKEEKDYSILDKIDFDVIVNQAGICIGGPAYENISELRENYEVNVFGTMNLIGHYIKNCKEKGYSGKILITSSLSKNIPLPYLGKYIGTKASLSILAKILKLELCLEKQDISVKLIEPGAYHTGFNQVMLAGIEYDKTYFWMHKLFSCLEKKETRTIVNKMVKAIESSSCKFYYSAPCSQRILAKIYQIFCCC